MQENLDKIQLKVILLIDLNLSQSVVCFCTKVFISIAPRITIKLTPYKS